MAKKYILIIVFFCQALMVRSQTKDLTFFLNSSRDNDPAYHELQNALLSNKLDSMVLAASTKIQVNGNGNAYYSPIIRGFGYDAGITNGQQLSAIVALNKQINNKRYLSLQYKDLQLTGDSLIWSSSLGLRDIKKNITAQYIIVYGDQLQLDFNEEVIHQLSKEESVLKILTQKNVYRQADYLSFLVTLQQQKLTRNQALVQYKNDYATLNYLSGIIDTATTTLLPPSLERATSGEINNSFFTQNFQIDSLRINNNKSLLSAQYRPKISLFADGGYQSTLTITPYKNFGINTGITLSIPLYDGHQRRLQEQKLSIAERTRLQKKSFFERRYQQQILQLEQQLQNIENLKAPIEAQLKYLKVLIDVNSKLLETGDIRITDFILALNNYIAAKNLVVQNEVARYSILQQLNYWTLKN
ncbi:MAG: TolC family protein [Bacteroidetes bacterium]|nr:TolC family protein [Bacteroidota bacterium]